MAQIALTFPDGARRDYPQGTTGLDVAKGISPSLAKRTVAMALDGALADLDRPHRARRQDRIRQPRRPARAGTDPARRRACARRSRAVAVAGHAGDHRPGDRQRLLLRLLPQPAVHAGRPAGHRKEDEGDHRPRQTLHQGSVVARQGEADLPRHGRELQGRAGRRHSGRPADQDLQAGRLVRSLPRPAHDLDRQGRQRLQADEGGRRLLARRLEQPDAHPHLRHRLRQAGRARRLPQAARRGREARPPPPRPRDGPVPFPGGSARLGVLARQGLDAVPGAGKLHPPPPAGVRLCRGQRAAAHGFLALGRLRPHGDLPRQHVPDPAARGRRARLRRQADELPRPHPDLQERAQILPRPALQARRIRQGAPLRAVGRAARADARARLHPGRRAYLHHRGADRRGSRSRSTTRSCRSTRTSASTT